MQKAETIQGRVIAAEDLALIRSLIQDHPDWNRTRISRELCRLWQWTDAVGRVKDMACRTLLLKLHRRGRIVLPEPQGPGVNHLRGKNFQPAAHDTSAVSTSLGDLQPIRLLHADTGPSRALWQTLLDLYHYLGFSTRVGKSVCYLAVADSGRPVACLLFGAAAWKTAARDRFIGWNSSQRQRNLHKVANNMRFLIPPWVCVPHLASHVLGLALRRLPQDWIEKYGHPVCLAETFVDQSRFAGTCYRAANWTEVGCTAGRSRNDVHHELSVPVKAVFVRPLCRHFRKELTGE
jgi:hypothetical protein